MGACCLRFGRAYVESGAEMRRKRLAVVSRPPAPSAFARRLHCAHVRQTCACPSGARARVHARAAALVLQAIREAVDTALLQADLAAPDVRSRPAGKLSGGMRRRLSVVRACKQSVRARHALIYSKRLGVCPTSFLRCARASLNLLCVYRGCRLRARVRCCARASVRVSVHGCCCCGCRWCCCS